MPLGVIQTLTIDAASTTAVAAAQTLVGAGDMTLASATVTLPNGGQRPQLTSTGNISGVTFTFYGTAVGNPTKTISYAMAGPNNNTVIAGVSFATITRVAASAAVGTNTSAGYAAQAETPPFVVDVRMNPVNIGFGCFTPTVGSTYTVQVCFDDPYSATYDAATAIWFNHAVVASKTGSNMDSILYPVRMVRLYALTAGVTTMQLWQAVGLNG